MGRWTAATPVWIIHCNSCGEPLGYDKRVWREGLQRPLNFGRYFCEKCGKILEQKQQEEEKGGKHG